MKKHKLYSLAMTGALSFGILGTSFPALQQHHNWNNGRQKMEAEI